MARIRLPLSPPRALNWWPSEHGFSRYASVAIHQSWHGGQCDCRMRSGRARCGNAARRDPWGQKPAMASLPDNCARRDLCGERTVMYVPTALVDAKDPWVPTRSRREDGRTLPDCRAWESTWLRESATSQRRRGRFRPAEEKHSQTVTAQAFPNGGDGGARTPDPLHAKQEWY